MKEQDNIKYTLEGFKEFIDNIKEMSSDYDYDYVVVRSRRCFNIIARFLPELDFMTFSALMSQYKKLADYYQQNKRFPKILLIDDLLFDGREMACDLERLEDILVEELLDRNILSRTDNYRYSVHSRLADSITTYVYAKSAGRLFIDKGYEYGYLEQLRFKRELLLDELRDYSLQLGEKLKQWDIANTNSTFSARTINEQNDNLENIISKQPNGRVKGTKWFRQEGICMGEPMILYTRLNGNKRVNRVDTIRYFPKRINTELPLVSSFSFFGALSQNTAYQLISTVREELEKAGLNKLAEILKISDNEKINRILLENQMQLINFILSLYLFFEFWDDMVSVEHQLNNNTFYIGDVWKCVRNFGKKTDLREELLTIRKKDLRNRLGTSILNIIDSNASELIPFSSDDVLNNVINIKETNLEKTTDIMRNILFRVEMQSRKSAYEQGPNKFDARNYQANISTNSPYGCDGVINFKGLFDLEEIKKFITAPSNIYSLIFATIGLMDNYQASLRLKLFKAPKGDTIVQNCIITHKQAGFYLPEKLAQLIPLFTEMESNTFGSAQARVKNFHRFIMSCFGISLKLEEFNYSLYDCPLEITDSIKQRLIEDVTHLSGEESLELALEKFFAEVERFYYSGNSFSRFNFDNLEVIAKQRLSFIDVPQLKKCLTDISSIVEEKMDAIYNQPLCRDEGDVTDDFDDDFNDEFDDDFDDEFDDDFDDDFDDEFDDDLEDPQEEGPRLSLTNNQ